MSNLLDLPVEILQLIATHQDSLYRYDLEHCNRSASFWAIRHGNSHTAALSLNAGPYSDITNDDGDTPLTAAAQKDDLSLVKQAQTLETRDDDDGTPLILAAVHGEVEIVNHFLNHGATVEAKDRLGYTALAWAADCGSLETVDTLIKAGAVVNFGDNYGTTPLALAASQGHEAVVERLLEAGADPNAGSDNRWTALHCAAWNCPNVTVLKRLLEAGADPRIEVSQNLPQGRTPADLARTSPMGSAEEKNSARDLLWEAVRDRISAERGSE
ncbi:ankyrin repeat-containing domain protein [Aspergillus crustosus]